MHGVPQAKLGAAVVAEIELGNVGGLSVRGLHAFAEASAQCFGPLARDVVSALLASTHGQQRTGVDGLPERRRAGRVVDAPSSAERRGLGADLQERVGHAVGDVDGLRGRSHPLRLDRWAEAVAG